MTPLKRSRWSPITELRAPHSALAITLRELPEELALVLAAALELAIVLPTEEIRTVRLGF